ncbi:MAG: hypothetical protein WA775_07535, partial [Psychroserpens sp.]
MPSRRSNARHKEQCWAKKNSWRKEQEKEMLLTKRIDHQEQQDKEERTHEVQPGDSFPLGATVRSDGINFCLYAPDAIAVELLLFDPPESPEAQAILQLDPDKNRTSHYWHVFVPGLCAGQAYAYRVDGPYDPDNGLRFNRHKVLLDPYARVVAGWENYSRAAATHPFDNCAEALRAIAVDVQTYD